MPDEIHLVKYVKAIKGISNETLYRLKLDGFTNQYLFRPYYFRLATDEEVCKYITAKLKIELNGE